MPGFVVSYTEEYRKCLDIFSSSIPGLGRQQLNMPQLFSIRSSCATKQKEEENFAPSSLAAV